jgi:hypothetical protein
MRDVHGIKDSARHISSAVLLTLSHSLPAMLCTDLERAYLASDTAPALAGGVAPLVTPRAGAGTVT